MRKSFIFTFTFTNFIPLWRFNFQEGEKLQEGNENKNDWIKKQHSMWCEAYEIREICKTKISKNNQTRMGGGIQVYCLNFLIWSGTIKDRFSKINLEQPLRERKGRIDKIIEIK